MTTEQPTGASIIDRVAGSPVGFRRVEDTLASLMSLFGLLFGLESVPSLLAQWPTVPSLLGLVVLVLVYGTILVAELAVAVRVWARPVFLVAGAAYLVCLVVWPFSLAAPLQDGDVPWILSIAGIACGFVVTATRTWVVPVLYTAAVATAFTLIRSSPVGGGLPLDAAALESAYTAMLSLALLLIVVSVRTAARSVDRAQSTALGRYADAQIDQATEAERTRTDALVHDSVLTTFLSAAAAMTPEGRALAAGMAQHAMNVLSRATVASHSGPKVLLRDLPERLRDEAGGIVGRFEYAVRDVSDRFVPDQVADAILSAAVQAMTNSVKHAGGPEVRRSVVLEGTDDGGVRITVTDGGKGFDPDAVASERLGLRVSIIERMSRVGGEVDIVTAPGKGATFVLSWPAVARNPVGRVQQEAVMSA